MFHISGIWNCEIEWLSDIRVTMLFIDLRWVVHLCLKNKPQLRPRAEKLPHLCCMKDFVSNVKFVYIMIAILSINISAQGKSPLLDESICSSFTLIISIHHGQHRIDWNRLVCHFHVTKWKLCASYVILNHRNWFHTHHYGTSCMFCSFPRGPLTRYKKLRIALCRELPATDLKGNR